MNIERRKFPRTQPEKLTYIHLQSDNGAIILNFSEDGLCFRSAGPMLETGPVRFTFSLQPGQQPQAIGELVWTDKARKKGGLRLTEFPAEARNPLNVRRGRLPDQTIENMSSDNISAPMELGAAVPTQKSPSASSSTPGADKAISRDAQAAPVALTTPSRAIVRIAGKPRRRYRLPTIPWDAWRDWTTINWRVVVGFAVLIISLVALARAYADRIEQSMAYDQATSDNLSLADQPAPASEPSQPFSPLQELRAQIAALQSEDGDEDRRRSSRADADSAKSNVSQQNVPDPITYSPATPATDTRTDTSAQSVQAKADASEAALSADAAPSSDVPSEATPKAEEVEADPASSTYYDVGNFKDLARADKATDDLGKLGFRAIVVHKMLLWMGSFHVVVGPFSNDQDSEAARSRLENLGFSPRIAKTH